MLLLWLCAMAFWLPGKVVDLHLNNSPTTAKYIVKVEEYLLFMLSRW